MSNNPWHDFSKPTPPARTGGRFSGGRGYRSDKTPTYGKLRAIPVKATDAPAKPVVKASFSEADLSAEQRTVYQQLVQWTSRKVQDEQLLTLGGYAGVGKTALLGLLGRKLRSSGKRIAYCAFTGKASLVLKQKLQEQGGYEEDEGSSCGTLHRLMYRPDTDEKTGEVLGWTPVESIESDLIVLDEASMIDRDMYEQLASYGVPILAVGDHGQLPPIRGDGFNLMEDPMLRLEKIHRQAEGNPILLLTQYIRETGRLPSRSKLPDDPRLRYVRPAPGWLAEHCGYTRIEDAAQAVVLVGRNATRSRVNAAIRAQFGRSSRTPLPDDMIVVLKNARFEGEKWIYNGQRGVVREARPGDPLAPKFPAIVDFADEMFRADTHLNRGQFGRDATYKSFEEMAEDGYPVKSWVAAGLLADFGYALTCHKAQGAQFPHVVVIPERMGDSADEWRRWLYTACSRSSDSLTLAVNG